MRYPILKTEEMSAEQREILEKIKSEQTDVLRGPYGAILYAPKIAGLLYELDKFLTEGLQVPERLRVVAVLTAAAKHRTEDVQKYMALKSIQASDLDAETITAIANRQHPISAHDDENLVHEFVFELITRGRVSNSCFDRAAQAFGRVICLELVKIAGFTIFFNGLAAITERMPSDVAA